MKTKKIPLILSVYFILTFLIWMAIRENDWFFYKYTLDFLKKPELSNDVVLVDISYPNRVEFRKDVGLFLQKMAELPEKPLSAGLDIIGWIQKKKLIQSLITKKLALIAPASFRQYRQTIKS